MKIRRSTLIFPVNQRKFIEKAHTRGADAISLDLEDSVPPAEKAGARKLVREAISMVGGGGAEVLVRVNNDPELLYEDIDAAVYPGLSGIHFPKAESAAQIHRLNALIEAKERERGMAPGSVSVSAHIETPLGLLHARSIAQECARLESMGVGPEDYCFSLGVEPSEDGMELLYAVSQVVTICKAMKIRAHGLLGSVAGFRDLKGFEGAALRGRKLGTEGAGCIHPDQVPILHKIFSPSPESVQQAHRVIQAFKEGVEKGTASVNLDGKMVDIPVFERARIILERAEAIEAVERRKAEALAKKFP
ncbi:MAG: CoA ester lyase [Thermodesulfobacteriota bacterium]|nr:CoA ester lyase [Thermodesulfobacteriota bacterium]